MDKKDLAAKIFNDLIDDYFIDDLIKHREEIIKSIEGRLSSYLIIEGGNILRDKDGKIRK